MLGDSASRQRHEDDLLFHERGDSYEGPKYRPQPWPPIQPLPEPVDLDGILQQGVVCPPATAGR